jgi:hypothetical protein
MAAVSETIVREFFELHGFLVRQGRKYVGREKGERDGIDFFIWNPRPVDRTEAPPFVLRSEEIGAIARAVVVVRGWHSELFGPGLLEHSPDIVRFVEPAVFQEAARVFSPEVAPLKILVVPALAQTERAREQIIELLRAKGVDAVIPFHTMLADLIARVEVNRNYDKSDLLQIIRVLKNYRFFKDSQLELFRPGRRRKA